MNGKSIEKQIGLANNFRKMFCNQGPDFAVFSYFSKLLFRTFIEKKRVKENKNKPREEIGERNG